MSGNSARAASRKCGYPRAAGFFDAVVKLQIVEDFAHGFAWRGCWASDSEAGRPVAPMMIPRLDLFCSCVTTLTHSSEPHPQPAP